MTLRISRLATPARAVAVLVALLTLAPTAAFGLATEHFGNAPVMAGEWGFDPKLLPVLNDTRRIYWYEVNGDASFYFQGDTAAAHEALRRFAAVEKGLEVVVLPGPRQVSSLGGEKKMTADWELHVPGGFHLGAFKEGNLVADVKPTLYLHVRADRIANKATAAEVTRWLADLNADEFEVRERAAGELEKQGRTIEGTLRKALEGKPAPETKRRIGLLLEKMPGVNLGVLVFPEGVRVQGPEDRLARYRKGLASEDATVRGIAVGLVARWEPDPAAGLATLIKVLEDKNEYPRRYAASVLGRMGKSAAPALPALRAGLMDPDKNVRNAYDWAIKAIESAKDDPGAAERIEQEKIVREEIGRYLKVMVEKKKE